jgi:gamma-glutamylcyclotransferase (GGCT)/AIG2-like uncharacterized protein YtfP
VSPEKNSNKSEQNKFNLFVYGSLRDSGILKSVCGYGFALDSAKIDDETLAAELAFLPNHKRISPDNVYYYAVKDPASRIEGFIIYDLPQTALAEIDKYEGKRYYREIVQVNTAKGIVDAAAYLVSSYAMKKRFGDRFHLNLIHELWLRKRIEDFIDKHTRPGEKSDDAELERKAQRELLSTTERDLIISHYRSDPISDYFLEHELNRPRPTIKNLYSDSQAQPYIRNYLILVIKQVLLNQLEVRIYQQYRFELEHLQTSKRYFNRVMSLLIALQMMNNNLPAVDLIVEKGLSILPYTNNDLIDFVKYAINASKSLYDPRVVKAQLNRIRYNAQPGLVPIGAELELSNMGAATIEPLRSQKKAKDPIYNGFKYFADFNLNVLSWKLGGYIDDHSGSVEVADKTGFLELAPGRLNIAGELSRPATSDPWVLSQLIQEITNFYHNVKPHSLHLSFQLRKRHVENQKKLSIGFIKCLLVLGGGLQTNERGQMYISRITREEIIQKEGDKEILIFTKSSKRQWYRSEDDIGDKTPPHVITRVQQYKFIRLEKRANYEPLILCLKGLQLSCNPADYMTFEDVEKSSVCRQEYEELKSWAFKPEPISPQIIGKFINAVEEGLMNEGRKRPIHKLHYINWALNTIESQLKAFNSQLGVIS